MSVTPNLAELIDASLDARLDGLMTALPGRVMSYSSSDQTADVQPLIKAAYVDETGARRVELLPIVTHVPIVFPGGGGNSHTWPVSEGDTVLLVFSTASLDKWLDGDGRAVDPGDDRRHNLSDAVAIPGLRPRGASLGSEAVHPTAMVLAADEVRIGGATEVEPTLMGNSFLDALGDMLRAIRGGVASCTGGGPGATAIDAAITVFETIAPTYKTSIAKVK